MFIPQLNAQHLSNEKYSRLIHGLGILRILLEKEDSVDGKHLSVSHISLIALNFTRYYE